MSIKEEFIQIFNENIKREGADKLLAYLEKSDFFVAPASTKYHLAVEGGLCQHSLNVFKRFKKIVENEPTTNFNTVPNIETITICGLLHDLCKTNFYKTRNA